jgi:hypothetical protein
MEEDNQPKVRRRGKSLDLDIKQSLHKEGLIEFSPRFECELIEDANPYRLTGDEDLETAEIKDERNLLRSHPSIQAWINVFWGTLQPSASLSGEIAKAPYIAFQVKIMRILQEDFDLYNAVKLAESEWCTDCGGDATHITQSQFANALFEIVDVWTTTLAPEEYVRFLATLFHRLTRIHSNHDASGNEISQYVFKKLRHVKPTSMYRKAKQEAESPRSNNKAAKSNPPGNKTAGKIGKTTDNSNMEKEAAEMKAVQELEVVAYSSGVHCTL